MKLCRSDNHHTVATQKKIEKVVYKTYKTSKTVAVQRLRKSLIINGSGNLLFNSGAVLAENTGCNKLDFFTEYLFHQQGFWNFCGLAYI